MRSTRLLIVLVGLGSTAIAEPGHTQQANASVDPTTSATVRHLLQLTHTTEVMAHAMDSALPAQRAANPHISAAFWDALAIDVKARFPELIDSIVAMYARHFTQQELDQLVQFYTTPLGQRLAAEQPAMFAESEEMGRRWGIRLGRAIGDSLTRAGVPVQQ